MRTPDIWGIVSGERREVSLSTFTPDDDLSPTLETAIELLETARDLMYASGWSSERTGRFLHEFASVTENQEVSDRRIP